MSTTADSGSETEPDAVATERDDDPSLEGQRVLAHVMSGLFGSDAGAPPRIGRFVVLRRLGAGAMGEVYAAYDDELDRRVAIKLLHAQAGTQSQDERRLRREAQALARLADPHVVPVFEVGSQEGRLFLVMELVEGATLRKWIADETRSRGEILDMFEQVGRGLVAAHSAGVVHRDLKPDNVLVGNDGRARLVDFGLARAEAREPSVQSGPAPPSQHDSTIAGTPRYMAPEQFLGEHVDHRADQFAFCVSLYEALYGAPPFGGRSAGAIASKVLGGEIDPTPTDRHVPSAITRILRRGLAREPDQRFADTATVLAELRRARAIPRRRAWAAGIAVLGMGALAIALADQRERLACRAESERANEAWAAAREPLAAGIRATGLPYAEHTLARLEPEIDGWSAGWAAARMSSCLARADDERGDVALQDACLDDRLADLEALMVVLTNADVRVMTSAANAVASLTPVARCMDPTHLAQAFTPASDEQRDAIAVLRPRISEVGALGLAGRFADAQALGLALLPEVEASGHVAMHAELLRRLGQIESNLGDLSAAEGHLRDAYFLAGRHGLDRTCAQAATGLVALLAVHGNRVADGAAWLGHAEMMAARLDDPDIRVGLLNATGGLALERGRPDEAIAAFRETLELTTQTHGEQHPRIGTERMALGLAYAAAGDQARAREELQAAREVIAKNLGDSHPQVASAVHNLANVAAREAKWAEAGALHREALAIRQRTMPGDHLDVAASLDGIAGVLASSGDLVGAREHFERALAMFERLLGPTHPRLVDTLSNLAVVAKMQDRSADALELLVRACGLLDDQPGAERPAHAQCKEHLGNVYLGLGRRAEALAALEAALGIRERTIGLDHPTAALTLHNFALAVAEDGRPAEALAMFERADAVFMRRLAPEHPYVQQSRRMIGKTRLRLGDARGAIEPLELALAELERTRADPELREEIEQLLAQARRALATTDSRAP